MSSPSRSGGRGAGRGAPAGGSGPGSVCPGVFISKADMQSLMGSRAIAHENSASHPIDYDLRIRMRYVALGCDYFPTTARPGDVTKAHAARAAAVVKALALPHPCGHPVRLTPAHDPVPFLPFDDALLAPGGPLAAHLDPTCVLVFAAPSCLGASLAGLRSALCTVARTGAGLFGPLSPGEIKYFFPGGARFLWPADQLDRYVERTRGRKGPAPCWGPGYGASEADAIIRLVLASAVVAADWRATAPSLLARTPGAADHVAAAQAAVADLSEAAAAVGVVGAATASPDAVLEGMAPVDLNPPPQAPGETKVEAVVRLLLDKIDDFRKGSETRESAGASTPGTGRGRGPPGQRGRGRGSTARERLTARVIGRQSHGSFAVAHGCHLAGSVAALLTLAELFDNAAAIFEAVAVCHRPMGPPREAGPDAPIPTPVERFKPAQPELYPFTALKTAEQADARFEAHPLIVLEKAGLLPAGMSVILHSACAFETHPVVVARVLAHLRDADVCLILAAQPAWSADLYASMLAVEGAIDGAADAVDAPLLDMCEPARHGDWEGTAFPLVATLSDGTVRLAVRLAVCSYMAVHAAILGVLPFELAAKHYVAAGRRDAAAALEAAARAMERNEAPPTPFVGFKAQVFVLDACEAAFRAAGMKVELDENVDLLLVPEGREDSESWYEEDGEESEEREG